jgi:hypothetical protein
MSALKLFANLNAGKKKKRKNRRLELYTAQLSNVVACDPCTRNPSGDRCRGKERARDGRHSLAFMLVTDDTSQLPMSSLNELALLVYP